MYIKGFDKDLCCRGMQFEVGKTYDTGAAPPLEICSSDVFHFCESINAVHEYYRADADNRFCEVEVLGDIVQKDNKIGSNKIRIVREIIGQELDVLIGRINGNSGIFNTGDRNTGNRNTGDRNTGNWNTGSWNSCNYSSGFFCTTEPKIHLFNKETSMTVSEFLKSKYYTALISSFFDLVYIEDEIVKERPYKEACALWWKNMSDENKNIIKSIPNFDAEIFKEITGIEVEGNGKM